jgi:hypothetical protein
VQKVVSSKIKEIEALLLQEPLALEAAIEALRTVGTPLIEEVSGYSRFLWVTHFYYANQPVEHVAVYESHIPFNEERALLEPIAGTSLYAKTTIVPYNQVVHYGFSINDSLQAVCDQRMKQLVLDPFNPFQEEQTFDGLTLSVFQTPDKRI